MEWLNFEACMNYYLFWTYIKHTILIKVDIISRKMWALERIGQDTACPLRCKHAAVVQLLSCIRLFVILWTAAFQASLSFTISPSFSIFMSIESVVLSNHFILCHSLLLLSSVFPSIRVFSNESALLVPGSQSIGASASVSVLPKNIQSWFPLGLTVLISLLSKGLLGVFFSTAIQKYQFFWSNYYIYTWLLVKPQLWLQIFVGKVMSLLFNVLSMFVIAFLSRSKYLLIS